MNYFISQSLLYDLSGIEIAQLKRLNLFKKNKKRAKLTTLEYNNYLHVNYANLKLQESDATNLYDFFQNVESGDYHVTKLDDLQIREELVEETELEVNYGSGHGTTRVSFFRPVEYDQKFEKKQVATVKYFDLRNNLIKMDVYDVRGFKSSTKFFDQKNQLFQEIFYDANENPKIIKDYQVGDFNKVVVGLYRVDFNGIWYSFVGQAELNGFYLDCLNQMGRSNVFFSDRAEIADAALYNMQTKAKKIVVRHSSLTYDTMHPLTSRLNDILQVQFEHRHELSGMVVATKKQAEDARIRYYNDVPIKNVNVSPVNASALMKNQIKISDRKTMSILSIARIHHEKRIMDQIEIVNQIKETIPNVSLDIYGYVTEPDYQQKLQEKVKELNLESNVNFMGFKQSLESVFSKYQIFLMTSEYESFNMSMLESLVHGVVPVSYNINYGPADMIDTGINGYLIENGNKFGAAKLIEELFNNPEQLQEMSSKSYLKSKIFSEENTWKQWQDVLNDVNIIQK